MHYAGFSAITFSDSAEITIYKQYVLRKYTEYF